MANRRDLHIGITGDSAGFDRACQEAETKARGLDQELAKLERQQAAQEKVTARTAAAIKQYGSEQDKAALAARRLGTEAERSAQQAEQAQIRATAAADAYSRGLITEERSLRAAANAENAIERAAIKAAEAHRAAARAAEEQAQQERQLARDAELGAAAEDLAIFKASGRVREHNALLSSMEAKYGDVGKAALADFQTIETLGTRAASAGTKAADGIAGIGDKLSILGMSGPASIALILGALESLPTVATTAGGGIAFGLGGALSYLALKAQAASADVQAAFAKLKTDVSSQFAQISAPFHGVLMDMIADARVAFNVLVPSLQDAFSQMAPAVSRFAHDVADSASAFDPVIRSISAAFSNVLDYLGSQMGAILGNVATGIKAITDAVASNPQALADFADSLSRIVRVVGDSIGLLIRYSSQINGLIELVNPIAGVGSALLHFFGGGGKAAVDFGNALGGLPPKATDAQQAAQQLAKDMQTMGDSASTATDRTNAFTDALTRLFDPGLAAYEDTAKLRKAFDDLTAALKKSHGAMGDNSTAAADVKLKFAAALKLADDYAKALFQSGDTLDVVQRKTAPYILTLYKLSEGNKAARAQVDAFVHSLQLVPPKKGTELFSNAAQAKAAIEAYQRQLNALKDRTVHVNTVYTVAGTTFGPGNKKLGIKDGGAIHRALGGNVARMAGGGPSGPVVGPGSGTSDDIPVWLSNGEYVINAAATAANRSLLDAINSGVRVPTTSAVMSGTSGGGDAAVFSAAVSELRAAAANLRNAKVLMDGQPVGEIVSRHIGRATDQRRRTG